jgi:SAM-dependent methyltransferase
MDFSAKRILEVGSGEQFYTAYFFLSAGAESVWLADPVFTGKSIPIQQSQLKQFQDCSGVLPVPGESTVRCFHSLDTIPGEQNGTFDFICSNNVLEHFSDLENYFQNVRRLLAPRGISCNFVDLSDHAYHVFDARLLTKWIYRTRMLNHLKYSDSLYDFITDRRIWTNRLLVPAYKALSIKNGLKILDIVPFFRQKAKIHPDVLNRYLPSGGEDLDITHFSILLSR